jgi:hypothetical protein
MEEGERAATFYGKKKAKYGRKALTALELTWLPE